MSASTNEKTSGKERKDIWVELQSLRQDAQAFRAEAYRLRVAGSLDAATNERLRTQQLQLERRGESLIKRLSPELKWGTGPRSAGGNSMDTSQLWLPGSQMVPTSGNSLQLQGT